MNQNDMDKYKDILSEIKNDPYKVNVKSKLLPYELLTDNHKSKQVNILNIQPYEHTFGKKSTRKRPKLDNIDINQMIDSVDNRKSKYNIKEDKMTITYEEKEKETSDEKFITAGQSKRIWDELYKVLDSSDVIMQVLDARDPEGTRCKNVES